MPNAEYQAMAEDALSAIDEASKGLRLPWSKGPAQADAYDPLNGAMPVSPAPAPDMIPAAVLPANPDRFSSSDLAGRFIDQLLIPGAGIPDGWAPEMGDRTTLRGREVRVIDVLPIAPDGKTVIVWEVHVERGGSAYAGTG